MPESSQRAKQLQPTLINYFQQNANRVVTSRELLENLPQFDERQMTQGMWHLVKRGTLTGLERKASGIWQYTPGTEQGKEVLLFEVLKGYEDGWLVTDEHEAIYRITRIG